LLTAFCFAQKYSLLADPTSSPSAIAAVRLKYHPPDNWIRHYLGDDRYKVAGNVWKVVSTQTDAYYHRPNCPNMLRQPAGVVIGFADSQEAEEAGYAADPLCAPRAARVEYQASTTAESTSASNSPFAPAKTNTRIVLSDGVSTTMLPAGWIHIRNKPQANTQIPSIQGASFDVLVPVSTASKRPGRPSMLLFMFMTAPNNIRVEEYLSPDRLTRLRDRLRTSSRGQTLVTAMDSSDTTSATLGGLKGVRITPRRAGGGVGSAGMPVTIVGRGSKLYFMASSLDKADAGYNIAVNSFQPR
jgi:hypothetical protein